MLCMLCEKRLSVDMLVLHTFLKLRESNTHGKRGNRIDRKQPWVLRSQVKQPTYELSGIFITPGY